MTLDRHALAAALAEVGELLELEDENPFKVRAYATAARTLRSLEDDIGTMIAEGRLATVPGFGKAIVEMVTTLHATGTHPLLDELRERTPPAIVAMAAVPGVGAKKARLLHAQLGLQGLDDLEVAVRDGRLATVKGFGPKIRERVAEGIAFLRDGVERKLFSAIEDVARDLVAAVRAIEGVESAELVGSVRRRSETVGGIDVLAACTAAREAAVREAFTSLPSVASVVSSEVDFSRVKLGGGVRASLRLARRGELGSALVAWTGSTDFVAAALARAGIDAVPPGPDEASALAALGLPHLAPEQRESADDLREAREGGVPTPLITDADVRGLLHVHSTWSDGRASLADMVRGARELGYAYVGMSDHSQSATYANGMTVDDVSKQAEEIEALRNEMPDIRIFRGVESDILADGSLDYPDAVLERMDFVIASVHSQFRMNAADMTRRLVKAIEHPCTRILGHPTGRLLLAREGYTFDLDAVLEACARHGVAIELNASPHRLDLDWRHLRKVREMGVKVAIDPDAHRIGELRNIRFGIGIARKGWLTPSDVINTRGPEDVWRRSVA